MHCRNYLILQFVSKAILVGFRVLCWFPFRSSWAIFLKQKIQFWVDVVFHLIAHRHTFWDSIRAISNEGNHVRSVRWASVRGPFGVCSGSVRGSVGVRSGSVWSSFRISSESVRDPFGIRSGSVRGPFGVRSGYVPSPF